MKALCACQSLLFNTYSNSPLEISTLAMVQVNLKGGTAISILCRKIGADQVNWAPGISCGHFCCFTLIKTNEKGFLSLALFTKASKTKMCIFKLTS